MAEPRNYHSLAVLLPDGRVFSGGGGLCGMPDCQTDHPNGQIYTPGYLLNRDGSARRRPTILHAPRHAEPGDRIVVRAHGGARSFSLVRDAAATHSVDNDQRRVPLKVVHRSGERFVLRVPADAGVALPGDYMLFAMDGRGTPSVSTRLDVRVP